MTSSKFMLIFLGLIFIIIVILSSRQISGALRQRFGKFLPPLSPITQEAILTPSPTPLISEETITPTPTSGVVSGKEKINNFSGEIPATGPEEFVWLILGGSFFVGVSLKKIIGSPQV